MSDRVCAVVVTYNRKELLRHCLASLKAQTRPLDQIVIVNNASTDGTRDMLERDYPEILALHLPENTGGAGGFHAGMKWSHEQGYDWTWVMDDDVETLPNAIEVMLTYSIHGDLIQSRKQLIDGVLVWEAMWDVASCMPVTFPEDISFKNGKKWTSISYANFEGALIHRRVMDRIGYPDVRYFMAGDDTMYGFLASLHTSAIYIDFVGMSKKVKLAGASRLHYYLQLRNRFLSFEHMAKAGVPVSRLWFWFFTLRAAGYAASAILQTPHQQKKMKTLLSVYQGVRDGARGRFGRPFFLS